VFRTQSVSAGTNVADSAYISDSTSTADPGRELHRRAIEDGKEMNNEFVPEMESGIERRLLTNAV
jgi:hypothetical protein